MTDTTTEPIADAPTEATTDPTIEAGPESGTRTPQTPSSNGDSPAPLFTDFGVDEDLAAELRSRGIVHPFPIQELTLPLGLKGHDLIGQARTGTGKTLGFGLPLLQRIDTDMARTQALVIVPTRELCIQVADDLTVGAGRGITSIAVYGGVGYDEQIEALTTGVHVVVGTPGRTLDHLGRGNLDVSRVHTVVLDEADEMLDMGFLPDVERLLADVPEQRQTLLFSATMPTAIVKLARRFMDKPTFMRADETLHETAPTVDQHFFLVHRMDKPRVLARLLQMPDRGGAFVFCRTKRMCDRLVQELDDLGLTAIAVHGDLRQSSRERNLDRFRAGTADVLVATEVAARGLDVSNVTHVVNYDCPDDEKMYLHRIGRTARAGESGVAITFAEFNEVDRVNVIRKRVGTEQELTEVFSTSDTLTELFDLPEATPWDTLGSSSGSSSRSSKGRSSTGGGRGSGGGSSSGRGSSDGRSARGSSKGRDSSRGSSRRADTSSRRSSSSTATASSSGSNRSSGRNTDQSARGEDRRSRRRPDRTSEPSGPTADTPADTGERSSRAGDGNRSRSRTRTRRRGSDERTEDRGERITREATTTSHDDTSTTRDAESSHDQGTGGRTSSGGRKRARRNRRRGGASTGGSSSTPRSSGSDDQRSSSGDTPSGDSSRSRRGRGGADGDRATRTGSGDRGRGSSGARSSDHGGGMRTRTTSRGSDARGDGTPRLDRRVDVEHLP